MARPAMFDDIRERFFHQPYQAKTVQGAGAGAPLLGNLPRYVDLQLIKKTRESVTQGRDPLDGGFRNDGTGAGVVINDLAKVVPQHFEQGEHALVGERLP